MRRTRTTGRGPALASERGSTMVFVGLAIAALLGMVALGVDVGMLLTTRSEAQRAADSAALAGAGSLITKPGLEEEARQEAIHFGELNPVGKIAPEILPEDVDVDVDAKRVTVRVQRTAERNSAVATWFARLFGADEVDVAAMAIAEAVPAGGATCLKPFTIPDLYQDVNGNNEFDPGIDHYDNSGDDATGYGSSYRNPGQPGYTGPPDYIDDRGREIIIKGGGPDEGSGCCPATGPSWYYLWAWGGTGGDNVRENIADRCNHDELVTVGDEYDTEQGVKHGPDRQGFQDMYDKDPHAEWSEGCACVVNSKYGENWEQTERIGIIPVFHPGRPFESGKKPVEFTNFIAVFLESIEGHGTNQVIHARILKAVGVAVGGGAPVVSGAEAVRLVR